MWTATSEPCSVWPRAGRRIPPRQAAGPSVVRSGQGPEAKHHAGIWTCTAGPGSAPSASLSPSLFLLPLSSVFEVKVKRANVPDLSDIISCSGRLLGINKINLTTENKTKRREKERRKKEVPKPLGVREVRWGWACGFPGAFVYSFARKMPAQTWEGTGPGLARRPDSSGSGVMVREVACRWKDRQQSHR